MVLIRPLAETPHAPAVAAWLHTEWWAASGWTLAATEAFLRSATGPAAPCCFVAEQAGAPLGTATFDIDDLPTRRDLSPWLASVWVRPESRGQRIGAALVARVEAAARAQGHPRIWLFTPEAERFYAARGWQREGLEEWQGRQVPLMSKRLP